MKVLTSGSYKGLGKLESYILTAEKSGVPAQVLRKYYVVLRSDTVNLRKELKTLYEESLTYQESGDRAHLEQAIESHTKLAGLVDSYNKNTHTLVEEIEWLRKRGGVFSSFGIRSYMIKRRLKQIPTKIIDEWSQRLKKCGKTPQMIEFMYGAEIPITESKPYFEYTAERIAKAYLS